MCELWLYGIGKIKNLQTENGLIEMFFLPSYLFEKRLVDVVVGVLVICIVIKKDILFVFVVCYTLIKNGDR